MAEIIKERRHCWQNNVVQLGKSTIDLLRAINRACLHLTVPLLSRVHIQIAWRQKMFPVRSVKINNGCLEFDEGRFLFFLSFSHYVPFTSRPNTFLYTTRFCFPLVKVNSKTIIFDDTIEGKRDRHFEETRGANFILQKILR